MTLKKLLTLFFILCFTQLIEAQIKINEYSVSNTNSFPGTTYTDNAGNRPDWIELYNTSATNSVTIAGWYLSNDPTDLAKFTLPATATISPKGFLRVWCKEKRIVPDAPGHIHTNFELTQCLGDWIILTGTNGTSIRDSVQLRLTQSNHSRGRKPDGAATWNLFSSPTPATTNTVGTAFIDYVATPVANLPAGFYSGSQNITLSCPSPSVTKIYYTLNGSEPTVASALFTPTTSITFSATTVLRTMATTTITGYLQSFIETNTYFIDQTINANFGVVSISGGSLTANYFNGTNNTSPPSHLEYFEGGQLKTESYGYVNKNTKDVFGTAKQHGVDFETADDYGYNNALKHKFFNDAQQGKSDRASFEHVILKAAGADNYPADTTTTPSDSLFAHVRDVFAQTFALTHGLNVDGRRNKFVITYVNGTYKGVYDLREPVTSDYINYYNDVIVDSIDNVSIIGGVMQAEVGQDTAWTNLHNFIMSKSMTNVAYYNYVDSKLNMYSLIDYMIYNSYMVNTDFIDNNVGVWQSRLKTDSTGKWKFAMVNMDNIYALNKPGIYSNGINTDACVYQAAFGATTTPVTMGTAAMVEKLMTNPKFKDLYFNRFSELLNTTLTCAKLQAHLSYLENLLMPEMQKHIDYWGNAQSTLQQWQNNVDSLRQRLSDRCDVIDKKVVDCYNLSGPYNLNISVFPPDAPAEVSLDVLKSTLFTWSIKYFGDVNVKLKQRLLDTSKYEFSHWEFEQHIPSPTKPRDSLSLLIKTNDNIVVHYRDKYPVILFPTGFSPNGDGNNDVLRLMGTRWVTDYMVEIWNRWGELVYSSTDVTSGWDGNYKGMPSQTGVYGYVVKYVDAEGEAQVKKGNVTLIR